MNITKVDNYQRTFEYKGYTFIADHKQRKFGSGWFWRVYKLHADGSKWIVGNFDSWVEIKRTYK
jgi:hypothetical protein